VIGLAAVHRFEAYLAGSLLLVFGLLLLVFLSGLVTLGQLPALFLSGVGVIFLALALLKSMAPTVYEMPVRATLAYGTIAFVIGVVWLTLLVQAMFAGYILAIVLIFFGLLFMAYSRVRRST
jgi:hypothetical protein